MHRTELSLHSRLLDLLLAAGVALSLLLLVFQVRGAGGGGCGAPGCAELWAGPYGRVLGLPVALPAVLLYLTMFFCPRSLRGLFVPVGVGIATGAALWFVLVQIFLGSVCFWCLAAHCVALAAFVTLRVSAGNGARRMRLSLWGGVAAGSVCLAVLQGVFARTDPVAPVAVISMGPGGDIHSEGSGREISFLDGAKRFRIEGLPRLGDARAEHVLILYFDYRCAACGIMGRYLDGILDEQPGSICVVLLPVPLERQCHPALPPTVSESPGSCAVARMALAVWLHAPEAFPVFHRKALVYPDPDNARRIALQHMTTDELASRMQDPWVERMLAANSADWRALGARHMQLPKLVFGQGKILHGLPGSYSDFRGTLSAGLHSAPQAPDQ